MHVVNELVLSQLFPCLNPTTQEETTCLMSKSDEKGCRQYIRTHFSPLIEALSPESKALYRDTLWYFLRYDRSILDDVLASQQDTVFPEPEDPARFYDWVFDELFPEFDSTYYQSAVWKVEPRPNALK